jgi:hypothetical protein
MHGPSFPLGSGAAADMLIAYISAGQAQYRPPLAAGVVGEVHVSQGSPRSGLPAAPWRHWQSLIEVERARDVEPLGHRLHPSTPDRWP